MCLFALSPQVALSPQDPICAKFGCGCNCCLGSDAVQSGSSLSVLPSLLIAFSFGLYESNIKIKRQKCNHACCFLWT